MIISISPPRTRQNTVVNNSGRRLDPAHLAVRKQSSFTLFSRSFRGRIIVQASGPQVKMPSSLLTTGNMPHACQCSCFRPNPSTDCWEQCPNERDLEKHPPGCSKKGPTQLKHPLDTEFGLIVCGHLAGETLPHAKDPANLQTERRFGGPFNKWRLQLFLMKRNDWVMKMPENPVIGAKCNSP